MGAGFFPGNDPDRDALAFELNALRHENAALKRSEAMLRSVVDGIDDSLYAKDEQGRYVLANQATARVLNRSVAEVIGQDDTALFSPEFARQIMANDREIMADSKARSYAEFTIASGVSRIFVTTKWPFHDEHGRVIGVLGMTRDLTRQQQSSKDSKLNRALAAKAKRFAAFCREDSKNGNVPFENSDSVRVHGTCQDFTELGPGEDAIEEGRRRFQAIFENAMDGFLLLDNAGRVVGANASMCQLLGYSPDEILRLTASDLVPARDREQFPEIMDRLLSFGRSSGEGTMLCKDGSTRQVESQSVANILPGLHLAVHRDVTDRKRTAETLEASEKLFRAVFEGALPAMVLVDDDGRYVNANPAACELFGLPLYELLDRRVGDFAEPDFDARPVWEELRKSGSAEGLFRLVRPDGTVRETEFTAKADVLPGRHLSVLRDVSERRRSEESLRKSERRVVAILESITDAFFTLDRQWRFTYVNAQAERLLGRPPAELLGKNAWEEFSQAVGTAFEYQAHRALAEQVAVAFEEYYPDPLKKWFNVHAYPSANGISVYFTDITERKEAEQALWRYAERLAMLHETDQAILAARSSVQIAHAALERLGRIIPSWRGSVALIDLEKSEALIFAATGAAVDQFPVGARLPLDHFDARDVEMLQKDRAFVVDDIATVDAASGAVADLIALGVRSYMRIPLTTEGQLIGSLNLYSDELDAFNQRALRCGA